MISQPESDAPKMVQKRARMRDITGGELFARALRAEGIMFLFGLSYRCPTSPARHSLLANIKNSIRKAGCFTMSEETPTLHQALLAETSEFDGEKGLGSLRGPDHVVRTPTSRRTGRSIPGWRSRTAPG